jgi:hypothetical protein
VLEGKEPCGTVCRVGGNSVAARRVEAQAGSLDITRACSQSASQALHLPEISAESLCALMTRIPTRGVAFKSASLTTVLLSRH